MSDPTPDDECQFCGGFGDCGRCGGDGCGAEAATNPADYMNDGYCTDGVCTACKGSGLAAASPPEAQP